MPFNIDDPEEPAALTKWFEQASEDERRLHERVYADRMWAVRHIGAAVKELRAALTGVDDQRIEKMIAELLEVARDLWDYDPTSD